MKAELLIGILLVLTLEGAEVSEKPDTSDTDDKTVKDFYDGCEAKGSVCKGASQRPRPTTFQDDCWKKGNCVLSWKVVPIFSGSPKEIKTKREKDKREKYHLTIIVNSTEKNYAAVGYSKEGTMGTPGILVMECVKPKAKEPKAFISYTTSQSDPIRLGPGYGDKIPEGVSIRGVFYDANSSYAICNFDIPEHLKFIKKDSAKIDLKLGDKGAKHVAYAVGPMDNDEKYDISKHEGHAVASFKDIMGKSKVSVDKRAFWVKMHGSFMTIIYMILMPIGTLIGRFYRETWSETRIKEKRVWFMIHIGTLYAAAGMSVLAYIFIASNFNYWPTFINGQKHAWLGGSSVLILIIQTIVPWVINLENVRVKKYYFISHTILGIVCYFLGVMNLALTGIWLSVLPCMGIFVTFLWVGCHLSIYILLTTLLYIKDHEMSNNSHRKRAFYSWPMRVKTSDDAPGVKDRIIFLGIFVGISLIMTFVMISYINKGGPCNKYH